MKNEYKRDNYGNLVLVLNYDRSVDAEVTVEKDDIHIYDRDLDHPNYIAIPLEDWEEFKEFVETQINMGEY